MAGPGKLINDKQDIADVDHDIPADRGIIIDIAHGSFPYPVEVQADQVSISIQGGAARITTRGMIGAYKTNRHFSIASILTKIFGPVQCPEFFRNIKFIIARFIFFHYAIEDRKSTRLNSSHSQISYAVFCLKKKKNIYII